MKATGRDPLHMTWRVFNGTLERLDKLRRLESGEGQTIEERLEALIARNADE